VLRLLILILLLAGLVFVDRARAQTPENVLIVVNSDSPDSLKIGEYYQRKRAIPTDNLLRISVSTDEQIPRTVFERSIDAPIAAWIAQHRAHDRLLFIVLTKGIPLRISGTAGRNGIVASVDSELALLYRRMTGQPVAPAGPLPNPYFLGTRSVGEARPFSHERHDFYLVTRLDGYTVADVIGLIDRGSAAGRNGRFVLDQRGSITPEAGNQWLERAAEVLRALGMTDRVLLDTSSEVVRNQPNLLGYYSWGSNDPAMKSRQIGLEFEPGALAATFVSTDGRTFKEPPADWTYGRWDNPRTFFAGSPQSLVGDLIRGGVTGVAGHVAEPYLDATIRPDILFPAYVSGFTLAESFYLAMPSLSWQTIVIGDPLAAPFGRAAPVADAGIDSATELPTWFAARALKIAGGLPGASESAPLMLRAHSRLQRGDLKGAQESVEQATMRNPGLTDGHLLLGSLYERTGDFAKAIERYKRVVGLSPGHLVALNNLAYALALHQPDAIAEAVGYARRAAALAPRNPAVLDTLGWVLHLSGDHASARAPMDLAIKLAPQNAEMHLHSAVIDLSLGETAAAQAKLKTALSLDASLESRPETKEIRSKLSQSAPPDKSPNPGPGR
jgi:uncharacterized protein (TIGR03790 family)